MAVRVLHYSWWCFQLLAYSCFLTTTSVVLGADAPLEYSSCSSSSSDSIQHDSCREQTNHSGATNKVEPSSYRDTCRFYLAESSIPNAGFGIYTVDNIPSKVPLTNEADAPSIIVTDSRLHNPGKDDIVWNHANYFWDGSGSGEFEAHSVEESVVTFGSLCNYHTFLKNVKPFSSTYDDVIASRSDGSPGMGAYSYHAGYVFHSTRDILAGEEIFCDYGEEWLDGRNFGHDVVREEEYMTAANIIMEIRKGLEEQLQQVRSISSSSSSINSSRNQTKIVHGEEHKGVNEIGTMQREQEQQLDRVLVSIQNIVKHFTGRFHKILPDSLASLKALDDALDLQTIATQLAFHTVRKRTLEWIQSHGQCLDNLVPQVSTLPHAGRGAFAQRFIAKGQVIVPAPLLQIMDYESLNVHEFALDEQGVPYLIHHNNNGEEDVVVENDRRNPMGQQLLVNYCMSHEETSMYLCPQTNAILLNHCSTRKSYGGDCERYNHAVDHNERGANAELKWAIDWDPDTREWLNYTMDEIKKQVMSGRRGLSFDIVAIRDIHPGDEVFLDYGKGWEEDWEEHLETFIPPNSSSREEYIPIKELNDYLEMNIRTLEELQNNPYPENAQLACLYWPDDEELINEDSSTDEKEGDGMNWHTDGSMYHDKNPDYEMYGLLWKCHVVEKIEREDGSVHYTVEIYSTDGMTVWAANKKQRILTNYPLKSMQFVPSKYSSDQHLLGAFRSFIRIPDALFPEQWKDLE